MPDVVLRDSETLGTTTWFANTSQQESAQLLDDMGSVIVRAFLAPILAYRFYLLVHSTKLWSGKRPLILIRGRSLFSRIAAYAGSWGGGDVAMPAVSDKLLLAPTRYLLLPDGSLELRVD